MTRDEIRAALTDRTAVLCTLFGEASSEPLEGQAAVGHVIRHRALSNIRWWGTGFRGVCLAPAQFSCWSDEGANGDRLYAFAEAVIKGQMGGQPYEQLLWIADGLIAGVLIDPTGRADHYLTKQLMETAPPKWARSGARKVAIGAHLFMQLEGR